MLSTSAKSSETGSPATGIATRIHPDAEPAKCRTHLVRLSTIVDSVNPGGIKCVVVETPQIGTSGRSPDELQSPNSLSTSSCAIPTHGLARPWRIRASNSASIGASRAVRNSISGLQQRHLSARFGNKAHPTVETRRQTSKGLGATFVSAGCLLAGPFLHRIVHFNPGGRGQISTALAGRRRHCLPLNEDP